MSYGHHHNRFSPDFAEHKVELSSNLKLQQIPSNLLPKNFWVGIDENRVVLGMGNDLGETMCALSDGLVMPDEPIEAVVAEALQACWLWQEVNLTEDFWTIDL